jgi:hypothetical protein
MASAERNEFLNGGLDVGGADFVHECFQLVVRSLWDELYTDV